MAVCLKPELDLFERRPIQAGILRSEEVALKPLSALNSSTQIEFLSLGRTDCYRDLSAIYLRLRIKLMKDAILNTPHADGTTGIVNLILHSMFKTVSVSLNNKPVASVDSNYPYRAYIESLLNFGNETASVHLEPAGWVIDESELDSIVEKKNPGLDTRKAMFKNSCEVEVIGRLHVDMFNQHKYLINGVDLRVILSLESPNFYVMAAETDTSSLKILDATLYVPHVTVNPQILLSHETVLMKKNAIYNYNRVEVKSYTISPGSQTMTIDNVVLGRIPNLLIFGMVDNKAYCGNRSLNPFNFQHFDMKSIYLIVNGVQVPAQPIETDFSVADATISSRAYDLLIKETQIFDRAHQIQRKNFDKGFFLLAFDLTPDHAYMNGTCHNIARQGSVSIEARFSTALTKTITAIVYTEYDSSIEIDKERNVYTNY